MPATGCVGASLAVRVKGQEGDKRNRKGRGRCWADDDDAVIMSKNMQKSLTTSLKFNRKKEAIRFLIYS